jgi:poly(3-hydroxybutyrate) depolymerase
MNGVRRVQPCAVVMACAALSVALLFAVCYSDRDFACTAFRPGEYVSSSGYRLRFVVYEPPGAVGIAQRPLVIFLNGIESLGHDGRQQLKNRVAFSLYQRIRTGRSVGCVVLFPQAASPWSMSELDRNILCELVKQVTHTHNVDAARILLVGADDGARGAVKLSAEYPNRWMGAVLFSSGASPPFEGTLPRDFRVLWYQDPPSISGSGTPDLEWLREQYGGTIQWVDWAEMSLDDLWSMPGFSKLVRVH